MVMCRVRFNIMYKKELGGACGDVRGDENRLIGARILKRCGRNYQVLLPAKNM